MGTNDFYRSDDYLIRYETKERFLFENDTIRFWYRFIISCHEYQEWNSQHFTRYELYLFPDDESIHESRKENIPFMKIDIAAYGIILREKTRKGKFDEKEFEKLANAIDGINIESKIKVHKYQKIKGLINGTTFLIG